MSRPPPAHTRCFGARRQVASWSTSGGCTACPWAQLRLQRAPKGILSRREAILLGVLALLVHGAVIYWVNQQPTKELPIVPPEIPPMTIEFSRPAPPVVEPPPPPQPISANRWSNHRRPWRTNWQ